MVATSKYETTEYWVDRLKFKECQIHKNYNIFTLFFLKSTIKKV